MAKQRRVDAGSRTEKDEALLERLAAVRVVLATFEHRAETVVDLRKALLRMVAP